MDDKELFEQLARGPLNRDGFDEDLRRRINGNLDKPRRKASRPWLIRWSPLGASLLLVLAVVVGLYGWKSFTGETSDKSSLSTEQASASAQSTTSDRKTNPIPHSAVVIGLRADDDQGGVMSSSSYRTIFIAPENEEIKFIRIGTGIWMPYGSDFWKIDPVPDSLDNGNQSLEASRSGLLKQREKPAGESPSLRRTEKLLYAGNQFVSILQTTIIDEKGRKVNQSQAWVNEVSDLEPTIRARSLNVLEEKKFSLSRALGAKDAETDIDQWAIVRDNNMWVAKQPVAATSLASLREIQGWPTIAVQLTSNIVKDEPLALSWAEVKKLEPEAIDAFTSQDEDIAAIVTNDSIELIPYRLPDADAKKLSVPIKPNESIVMVQWATQEPYVESWKQMFSKWFALPAE